MDAGSSNFLSDCDQCVVVGITQSHPKSPFICTISGRGVCICLGWGPGSNHSQGHLRWWGTLYCALKKLTAYYRNGILWLTFCYRDVCWCVNVLVCNYRQHNDLTFCNLQDDGSVTAVAEATAIAVAKCYELPPYCRPPPPPPSPSPPSSKYPSYGGGDSHDLVGLQNESKMACPYIWCWGLRCQY